MYDFRGATLNSRQRPRPWRDTCISPATDVCPHVAPYSPEGDFLCALSGPFEGLFPTRLSASRALCRGMADLISASTVYCIQLRSVDHRWVHLSRTFMRHGRTKKKMQKPRSPAAAFATRKEERGKNEKEEILNRLSLF